MPARSVDRYSRKARAMNLVIFGAAGRIGERILREALARGHHVTAALLDVTRLTVAHPALQCVAADVGSAVDFGRVAAGQDAVVSAVGPGRAGDVGVIVRLVLS